jgi:hypothetical protein
LRCLENPGGWVFKPFQNQELLNKKERFADLATDRDYNYLADHVNANHPRQSALKPCLIWIFPNGPKLSFQKEKFDPIQLFCNRSLNLPACELYLLNPASVPLSIPQSSGILFFSPAYPELTAIFLDRLGLPPAR